MLGSHEVTSLSAWPMNSFNGLKESLGVIFINEMLDLFCLIHQPFVLHVMDPTLNLCFGPLMSIFLVIEMASFCQAQDFHLQ